MKLRKQTTPEAFHLDPKSRRMFLKSASGMMMAMPMLGSLFGSSPAHAAANPPLRFLTLFTPNGGLQNRNWLGSNLPTNPFQLYPGHTARTAKIRDLVTGNGLSTVLDSSYQNLYDHMNLIAGVDQPYYFGHNRCVGLGVFARQVAGMSVPYDQVNLSPSGMITSEYPSIDQVLANANGNGIYGAGLGGRRRQLNYTMVNRTSSWGRDEFDTTLEIKPRDGSTSTAGAFSFLFGSIPRDGASNPLINLINEFWPSGKALLKFLSAADRDSIEKLFALAQSAANDYSVPGPLVSSSLVAPPGTNSNYSADDSASFDALADIVAMAFQSDVTRVVNIFANSSLTFGGADWHALSHQAFDQKNPNAGQDGLVQLHKFISDHFFSRLANKLLIADPFSPSSSILDNSLLMWTHEHKMAHHNSSNPTLLIGKAGGRISGGNFADLRNLAVTTSGTDDVGDNLYPGDLMNRTWASILYAMNIPRSSYEVTRGGGSSICKPLSQGYGHVLGPDAAAYDSSQIGEPWSFLTVPGVSWG